VHESAFGKGERRPTGCRPAWKKGAAPHQRVIWPRSPRAGIPPHRMRWVHIDNASGVRITRRLLCVQPVHLSSVHEPESSRTAHFHRCAKSR
jgi:hypothetical protein